MSACAGVAGFEIVDTAALHSALNALRLGSSGDTAVEVRVDVDGGGAPGPGHRTGNVRISTLAKGELAFRLAVQKAVAAKAYACPGGAAARVSLSLLLAVLANQVPPVAVWLDGGEPALLHFEATDCRVTLNALLDADTPPAAVGDDPRDEPGNAGFTVLKSRPLLDALQQLVLWSEPSAKVRLKFSPTDAAADGASGSGVQLVIESAARTRYGDACWTLPGTRAIHSEGAPGAVYSYTFAVRTVFALCRALQLASAHGADVKFTFFSAERLRLSATVQAEFRPFFAFDADAVALTGPGGG